MNTRLVRGSNDTSPKEHDFGKSVRVNAIPPNIGTNEKGGKPDLKPVE